MSGIGEVLAMTIAHETGSIDRFETPGDFASYARTVNDRRESKGKKRTRETPNAAISTWLVHSLIAAHVAIRQDAAIKAVAHELGRDCFHVMKIGAQHEAKKIPGWQATDSTRFPPTHKNLLRPRRKPFGIGSLSGETINLCGQSFRCLYWAR